MANYLTCMECGSVEIRRNSINRDGSSLWVYECDECGNWEEAFTAAAPICDLMDTFDKLSGSEVKELRAK